jgi:transcriptional regulator with XRE-family HTH domain
MGSLGARLKSERCRLGLTQTALATIGGVRVNAQGHYELNIRMPRADYLANINRAGVDIMYVLGALDKSRERPDSLLNRWHP